MRLAFLMLLASCDLVFELRDPGTTTDAPQAPPFLDGYTARKSIDIRLGSTTPLQDLPFNLQFVADPDLVNVAPGVFEFTDADGTTTLDYEIEHYDPATGDLLVWVELPQLDNNRIYLYYAGPQVLGRDPTKTWSRTRFAGVWHFGAGATGLNDSTGTNMSFRQNATLPNEEPDCQIGFCRRFESDEDLIIEPTTGFDFGDTSFTVSLWVNATRSTGTQGTPFSRGSTANGGWGVVLESTRWYVALSDGSSFGGSEQQADFSTDPPFDTWTHLVAVVDREAAEMRTYVNGAFANEVSVDMLGEINVTPNEDNLVISRANTNERYVGRVDEARIYPFAISDAQIAVEYANVTQRDLVTVGPPEVAP